MGGDFEGRGDRGGGGAWRGGASMSISQDFSVDEKVLYAPKARRATTS